MRLRSESTAKLITCDRLSLGFNNEWWISYYIIHYPIDWLRKNTYLLFLFILTRSLRGNWLPGEPAIQGIIRSVVMKDPHDGIFPQPQCFSFDFAISLRWTTTTNWSIMRHSWLVRSAICFRTTNHGTFMMMLPNESLKKNISIE